MKKFLLIIFLPVFLIGCGSSTGGKKSVKKSPGRVKEKTFAQQYAALEKKPPKELTAADHLAFQTEDDRAAQVAIAAQQERRARAPIVESNYLFQIIPPANVYSYDEYGRVWDDSPQDKNYKEEKRLWAKPKRYRGDYEPAPPAPKETETQPAAPSQPDPVMEDDGDWGY